ncbi:hypothetical protein FRZ67_20845 [Panacibacter ginsenosidivorans]|uniref:DUF58 domain-containing protein n=1 Tax=Panacibacter ginsenosidivorans TaxID=1813871 RepID=A0A5B8VDY5_9BACT|nr:DUF58 domain-containing protein [Panacibacter ginsenosidivorans]QEC69630.1 hypothetical protein FRZ67_20845 [Panacibacter ginsenosidivorans]
MMGRLFKNIRGFAQPAVFFIPFTFYFVLFTVAIVLANIWLGTKLHVPDGSFTDIFKLLLKAGTWFIIIIICVALLSAFVSFLIFLVKKKKNAIRVSIKTVAAGNSNDPVQKIHISISPVLKPFLGFIKLRLHYDQSLYSEKFILAEEDQKKIFSTRFAGDYKWQLPEIKEYHVEKLIVYFEDFFQFFSFTVALPVQDRFHTHPFAPPVKDIQLSPRKTEDTATRIEELKKVEGEYLNYKNFENNDDVRRIVWKIYAKNKELVVRIPEVLDPYASHAYLYPSFYNSFDIAGNSVAEIFFLNYYKTVLWGIYQQLGKQGYALRFIQDQQTAYGSFNDEQQATRYAITTSKWQQDKDLKVFVNNKDASIIIISSLCNADDVQSILDAQSGGTVFVLVKLSKSLQHSYFVNMIKWLFVQQEKNEIEVYKSKWRLSLLRPKIMANEKKIEAILAKYSKTIVI